MGEAKVIMTANMLRTDVKTSQNGNKYATGMLKVVKNINGEERDFKYSFICFDENIVSVLGDISDNKDLRHMELKYIGELRNTKRNYECKCGQTNEVWQKEIIIDSVDFDDV